MALTYNFFRNGSPGDNRFENGFKLIAQRDTLDCSERACSVVTRADEKNKRLAEDFFMRAVKSAVKKVLHHPGHVTEIFRCAESESVGCQ